ncbi:DNA-binding NtrC family response regulator [Nonlabens dokdonensis]|uniref:Sigma-54 dependent DNA-binding response regulator, Fis family protein n=2 Tax=Nonlabens dokdonensis TaxID=328515 RepID=L7WCI9_NONDD|nr:sigma-54 dependent transcriptional regulator [Nonlabens dokdonensis]AGC77661.1 sigma-54 dependent DNA-binding response regulator, Fis family protein [Nonlabens dokdonensis DSW-6]PZX39797.1 DNA-binding NtrC family response regulator [Nonlabens dokdonensis]
MQLKNAQILIIDDDEDVLIALKLLLKSKVKEVVTNKNPNNIERLMETQKFDAVILDMNFNGLVNTGNEGIFWLNKVKSKHPDVDVILITAYADIDLAIRSLKKGATDFMVKPWKNDKMVQTLTEILKKVSASKTNRVELATKTEMVGESDAINDVLIKIKKVAPTEANILILGENGTGKELVAQSIHENSNRKDQPFVKVDIGSLTTSLFESELFGYKKGAFTDAKSDHIGRFEAAQGGTLFLDEIGNITLQQQSRLLSVLQNRKVIPLGSNVPVPIDIRLICATNLTMSQLADESRFRKDLVYRINTVDIVVPPLRDRGNDITVLAHHFADYYAGKYGKDQMKFSPEFLHKIKNHPFPGNIRELQHALERAVIMADESYLKATDLAFPEIEQSEITSHQKPTNLEDLEKNTILTVIENNNGNISKSAKELGLTRTALYRRLNKYDL